MAAKSRGRYSVWVYGGLYKIHAGSFHALDAAISFANKRIEEVERVDVVLADLTLYQLVKDENGVINELSRVDATDRQKRAGAADDAQESSV